MGFRLYVHSVDLRLGWRDSVREAYESYEAAFAAASGRPDEQGLQELQRAESLLASRLAERNALCRLNKNR